MSYTESNTLPRTKSYTNVYDTFVSTPFNIIGTDPKRATRNISVFQATCEAKKGLECAGGAISTEAPYVTSEKFYALNKDYSFKSIIRSTSTLFYDLDSIGKRHSLSCIPALSSSNAGHNSLNLFSNSVGFRGKSNAIVQECATQIHPRRIHRDSIEVNTKKIKKCFPNDPELSSEILLKDDYYTNIYNDTFYGDEGVAKRPQKFWSYAKYRTKNDHPVTDDKKSKKKDHGKRTENPCPCQLFSYACPCTDKKSLTELATHSKSKTITNQKTSTLKVSSDDVKKANKEQQKKSCTKENKDTSVTELVDKVDHHVIKNEPVFSVVDKTNTPTLIAKPLDGLNLNTKQKSNRDQKQIICPNCKEKVDVTNILEEDYGSKHVESSFYQLKEIPSQATYAYRSSPRRINTLIEDGDICDHEPRCELIPICQILPTDDIFLSHKSTKKRAIPKSTPRVIRLSKACRHHPPCTVVPSCQKATVLKNNCEFIPPCLHRPRCVNLPLCVPLTKSFHYDELLKNKDDTECIDCPHIPKCKYIPECQQDVANNSDQVNIPQLDNTYEYLNSYQSTAHVINPNVINTYSPCVVSSQPPCNCCKSNKSCQYECFDCQCIVNNIFKDSESSDAVIFIRDVGCQFRTKNYSPKNSKLSSASSDPTDIKQEKFSTNNHTLRYQEKYTNPILRARNSLSTFSATSLDVDEECPSHGRKAKSSCVRPTGFDPKPAVSPCVAFITQRNPKFGIRRSETSKTRSHTDNLEVHSYNTIHNPVRSRKSFIMNKYKKMFSVKRRKRSRVSSQISATSKVPVFY